MGFWSPFSLLPPNPDFHPSDLGTYQLLATVTSESVSDEAITQTMSRCWKENQYLLCPHSAVAVSYHYQQVDTQQSRYGCGYLGSWGVGNPLAFRVPPLPQVGGTVMRINGFNEHDGCSVELFPENRGLRRGCLMDIPGPANMRHGAWAGPSTKRSSLFNGHCTDTLKMPTICLFLHAPYCP